MSIHKRRKARKWGPLGNTREPFEIVRSSQLEFPPVDDSPIYTVDFNGGPLNILTHGRRSTLFEHLNVPPPKRDWLGWRIRFNIEWVKKPLEFFPDEVGDVAVEIVEKMALEYARKHKCVPLTAHFIQALLSRPEGIPERFAAHCNYAFGTVVDDFLGFSRDKWVPYIYHEKNISGPSNKGSGFGWNCGAMSYKQVVSLNPFRHRVPFLDLDGMEFVEMIEEVVPTENIKQTA